MDVEEEEAEGEAGEEEEPDFSGLDEGGEEAEGDLETEGEEEVAAEGEEETEGAAPGRTRYVDAPPAEWGVMPAILMLPCVIVLFVVGLMGYELIQGMYGYQKGTKLTGLVIDPIARMFDENLPKD
jgi:hypothetical protein